MAHIIKNSVISVSNICCCFLREKKNQQHPKTVSSDIEPRFGFKYFISRQIYKINFTRQLHLINCLLMNASLNRCPCTILFMLKQHQYFGNFYWLKQHQKKSKKKKKPSLALTYP